MAPVDVGQHLCKDNNGDGNSELPKQVLPGKWVKYKLLPKVGSAWVKYKLI